ncbi:MAG: SpoIIE family protein phosphatase [Bernardetiaceae bacterium]|nr:SpoIIE family protein phosphatase [Bernardetiaceae bacterium]
MNIYFKLLLFGLSLVLGTSGALYIFITHQTQKSLEQQAADKLSVQSVYMLNSIDRFIFERLKDIDLLKADPILSDPNSSATTIQQRLMRIQAQNPTYVSLSFFRKGRLRIADTENKDINKVHSLSKYWLKINADTPKIMDISRSESLGKVVMHFVAEVYDEQDEYVGTVVSRVLIDWLYEAFNEITEKYAGVETNVAVDIVDSKGVLLYSNQFEKSKFFTPYEESPLLNVLKRKPPNTFHDYGNNLYFYSKEQKNQDFIGQEWTLIFSIPKEVAYASIRDVEQRILWVFIPIFLIAILIALLFAYFISRPIMRLSRVAARIGEGDLDVKIPINYSDEIGKLGKTLRIMAAKLKGKIKEQEILNQQLSQSNQKLALKYEKINTQKNEIDKKNKAIMSSIQYAKRIQRSLLPEDNFINSFFAEYFLLYKPRDIVGGDFYWFDKITKNNVNYWVLAIADCTGHGVPGGFMSMLGNNLLTTIVSIEEKTDPAEILTLMNADIKKILHQENQNNNSQDGMEIAICVFQEGSNTVSFCNAGIPLYHIKNGVLSIHKGARLSIGGVGRLNQKHNRSFELHSQTLTLEKEDTFYLFSDGYKDQFGGKDGRTFSSKRLKQLLIENSRLPLEAQKQKIYQAWQNWQGNLKQTDDILMFGFKPPIKIQKKQEEIHKKRTKMTV